VDPCEVAFQSYEFASNGVDQSTTRNPSILTKSRSFRVTNVPEWLIVIAAIRKSFPAIRRFNLRSV
jgi:hypothetical protein